MTSADHTAIVTPASDDVSLLRAFEPVIRFTAGELFFPTAVEAYVDHAALWHVPTKGDARCIVPRGDLSIERLVEVAVDRPGAELSMRFVDAPLGRGPYRAWRRRPERPAFSSRGRFTRVGILSRVIDALFRIGLLLRGRVPGGLAAAAEQCYREELDPEHHPYYGRVVRDGGYVIAQYWFFYAMNDWRSNFGGANDHEADWEQVTVFLVEQPGAGLRPAWVAYSAHDEVGDDLRRRWDDPDLVREGDHPVVFAGAGSHSGAFVAGEYVTAIDPPGVLHRVFKVLQAITRVVTPWSHGEIARGVGVPFVDYSRGDGEIVGPGHRREFSPVLIDDDTAWVQHYRGLWGLDTLDRFGGERAPAGPRYERGGTVRQSWSDPLGWAGLQKVSARPAESAERLRERVDEIDQALSELDDETGRRRIALRRLVAERDSLRDRAGMATLVADREARIADGEQELNGLAARRASLTGERAAHVNTIAAPPAIDAPQAHLRHKVSPVGQGEDERDRFLRVWSTVSSPLLFLAAAWLILDHQFGVVVGISAFAVAFLTIEAIARGRLVAFALTMIMVIVAALVALAAVQGVFGQWRLVVAALLAAFALAILLVNLRDLRRG